MLGGESDVLMTKVVKVTCTYLILIQSLQLFDAISVSSSSLPT